MKETPIQQKVAAKEGSAFEQSGGKHAAAPAFQLQASAADGGSAAGGGSEGGAIDMEATIGKGPSASHAPDAAGGETAGPDLDMASPEGFSQFDAVNGNINYGSNIRNHGTPSGTEFGVTVPGHQVRGIRIRHRASTFNVRYRFIMKMDWSVVNTGPNGQRDIPNANSRLITAANYNTVASDLTPNMGDLSGRPPRTQFWNKALTRRHEQFHARDGVNLGRAAVPAVTAWLNAQTANNEADCQRLVTQSADRIFQAMMLGMTFPGREQRAYADGAPAYTSLANQVKTKGDRGDYR
jgi:hypothetical protein